MSAAQPPAPIDRTGRILGGRYRVERLRGTGAMGSVWEVRRIADGAVAVAKLHEAAFQEGRDPTSRRRFLRECEALAFIRHPNVVRLYEVGETEDGEPYIVMERLEGESLEERLGRERPTLADVFEVGSGALAGASAVHAAGVLHRDIKPDNIFLARERGATVVKLLDFGLARGLSWKPRKITEQGTTVGTPGYMSPEQARGRRDLDQRADVYSVGVVLYEMLAGRLPIEGESIADLMVRTCIEDPRPLTMFRPDLDGALVHVVMTAIARDRNDRFPDANAMREALVRCANAG